MSALLLLSCEPCGGKADTSGESVTAGRTKSCDILMAIDEPLWEHKDRNMTELEETAHLLVDKLNDIFAKQIFIEANDNLYFRLARVQVCD